MTVTEYLKLNGLTISAFADMVGCSKSYVSYSITSPAGFSQKIAERIEAVTDGAVTVEELRHKTWRQIRRPECQPLADYLRNEGITLYKLAELAGVTPSTLYGLMAGRAITDQTKFRISRATGGVISPADLISAAIDVEGDSTIG